MVPSQTYLAVNDEPGCQHRLWNAACPPICKAGPLPGQSLAKQSSTVLVVWRCETVSAVWVEQLLGHRETMAREPLLKAFKNLTFNYFSVWLLLLHHARVKVRGQLAGASSLLPRSREGRQVVVLDGLCLNPLSQLVGLNALPNRSVCLNGISVYRLTFKGWPSGPVIQCVTLTKDTHHLILSAATGV